VPAAGKGSWTRTLFGASYGFAFPKSIAYDGTPDHRAGARRVGKTEVTAAHALVSLLASDHRGRKSAE
jgi:hypothetical protein